MKEANRKIIIPRGTLNSDEVNVVIVPPSLQNSSQPLIVKPTSGNKLAALSLPIWGDELDTSPVGRAQYEKGFPPPTEPDDEDFTDDSEYPDFEKSIRLGFSPSTYSKLVHLSSKTMDSTNDGPPETFEMTFDAPYDGVDMNVFQTVLEEGVKEESNFTAFEPHEVSSLDEYEYFNPIFSSTMNPVGDAYGVYGNNPYYPDFTVPDDYYAPTYGSRNVTQAPSNDKNKPPPRQRRAHRVRRQGSGGCGGGCWGGQ